MSTLLICLCKNDDEVIKSAKGYLKGKNCFTYFGGRANGIQGQLNMLNSVTDIVVTAHGSEDEIGEALENFMDVDAAGFATILNKANFVGNVYFDVCYGHKFGTNVKKSLTCSATIYGAKEETDMDIDLDKCVLC
jgi:hypothetical protein